MGAPVKAKYHFADGARLRRERRPARGLRQEGEDRELAAGQPVSFSWKRSREGDGVTP